MGVLSTLRDPTYLVGALAVALALVALLAGLRQALAGPRQAVLDRLARASVPLDAATTSTPVVTRQRGARPFLAPILRALARLNAPSGTEEVSRTRARLDHAGLRAEHAAEMFYGAKILVAFVLSGGFAAATSLSPKPVPNLWMFLTVLAAIGFYAPNAWLAGRVEERQRELSRAIPDALDLLVTCVEAGLGIEAAIARVVEEMGVRAPLLTAELSQMMAEIRAGVARGEAFRRLAARTGLEELRALSAVLIQTEIFGTSVARALRIQSDGMRIKRTQRAEEKAATVATKMLIPLILCILPSLFTVIMGPAIVRIIRILMPELVKGSE